MLASAGQIVVTFALFAVAQCAPREFPLLAQRVPR